MIWGVAHPLCDFLRPLIRDDLLSDQAKSFLPTRGRSHFLWSPLICLTRSIESKTQKYKITQWRDGSYYCLVFVFDIWIFWGCSMFVAQQWSILVLTPPRFSNCASQKPRPMVTIFWGPASSFSQAPLQSDPSVYDRRTYSIRALRRSSFPATTKWSCSEEYKISIFIFCLSRVSENWNLDSSRGKKPK